MKLIIMEKKTREFNNGEVYAILVDRVLLPMIIYFKVGLWWYKHYFYCLPYIFYIFLIFLAKHNYLGDDN